MVYDNDVSWHLLRVCYVLIILKCFTYIKRDILRIMNISIAEGGIMSIMAWKMHLNIHLQVLQSQHPQRLNKILRMSETILRLKKPKLSPRVCLATPDCSFTQRWYNLQLNFFLIKKVNWSIVDKESYNSHDSI